MGEKWNDSRPAEKLLSFYTMLLFSRIPISLTDAAQSLECSKQTVGRLADQLESSRYGKLNKNKIGREVYYSLEKPRKLPAVSLNAEALTDLALCQEFIQKLLPPAMSRKTRQSLNQAAAFLSDPEAGMTDGIGASLAKGPIDYEPFEDILRTFVVAITQQRICSVIYRARRHQEVKHYEFAPKRLIAFHESIFVYGFIVEDVSHPKPLYDKPTLLAIHRFVSCEITRRKSTGIPEPELDANSYLGIFKVRQFPIKAYFKSSAATYVAERKWSRNQKIEEMDNGDIILTAEAINEQECLSWILSFGGNAELLEPDWMRDRIREELARMRGMYGNVAGAGKREDKDA